MGADSACNFTVAVKRGCGGGVVAFGAEDFGMSLFQANELFGHFREVILAGILDGVKQKFADNFREGGFAVDCVNARGTVETVIDGDGDVWHVRAPGKTERPRGCGAFWA